MKTTVRDCESAAPRTGVRGRGFPGPGFVLTEADGGRQDDAAAELKRSFDPGAAILAFAGSSRRGSFNGRLIESAVLAGRTLGARMSILDLRDLDLPIYDPGVRPDDAPEGAMTLRRIIAGHDGFLIASPEYNGSLPPILKNALDWCSRAAPGEQSAAPFRGKVAAIMSASPVLEGGACCLDHLRLVLSRMGVLVLPEELCLSNAAEAFAGDTLADPDVRHVLNKSVATLLGTLRMCRSGACAE